MQRSLEEMKLFRHLTHGERFAEEEYPLLPLALQQVWRVCGARNDFLSQLPSPSRFFPDSRPLLYAEICLPSWRL